MKKLIIALLIASALCGSLKKAARPVSRQRNITGNAICEIAVIKN